jgi:hypothetical protein
MTVLAYGFPQLVQTRHTGVPEDGATVACVCVDVNLRQSALPGNRNPNKPWFRPSHGSFKNGPVQVRGLGLAWWLHGQPYEWRLGLILAVI